MQRHVPQQIEHEPCLVAQRIGGDREEIVCRGRRERAAHAFDRAGDLLRVAVVRSLGEQFRDQAGQPLLARWVVNAAGAEGKGHRDHRLLMVLDHHELHAVGERRLLERREPNRRKRRRLGRRRGEALGGHAVGPNGGKHRRRSQTDRPPAVPPSRRHCAPPPAAGFTTITTAFAGSRYLAATRRISAAVTARKRSKSLLISASDGWNMS